MLDRLIAEMLLWGMRGGLAWFIAHEYATFVDKKLAAVSRALSSF